MAHGYDVEWMSHSTTILTSEEYKATPFGFGSTVTGIIFMGSSSTLVTDVAAGYDVFSDVVWGQSPADAPWEAAVKLFHNRMLVKYFTLPALRVLCLIYGVDKSVTENTVERSVLCDRYAPRTS